MKVTTIADPADFLNRAGALLLADEPRHSLMLGVAGTLLRAPDVYPEYRLWVVEDGDDVAGAALITPPYNLVLSDIDDDAARRTLAEVVHRDGIAIPGVLGNRPTVDRLVEDWRDITGAGARLTMEEGAFALTAVRPPSPIPGRARTATFDDRDRLIAWTREFATEAFVDEPPDLERLEAITDRRLSDGVDSGTWVWEKNGDPVSLAGFGGATPNGIRIGPVYTPPQHREHGYASALVAALSSRLLTAGRRFCFLYTDLANPTSNAIYRRIGYEPIAEAAMYAFTP